MASFLPQPSYIVLTKLAKLANIESMKAISIHDAKTNLSKYITAAKKGEKVYIGGFGKAEVLLIKLPDAESDPGNKRSFSLAKGKITDKQDAFSNSTDQSIATLLYGD